MLNVFAPYRQEMCNSLSQRNLKGKKLFWDTKTLISNYLLSLFRYLTTTICGDACPCPPQVVSVLFWIGIYLFIHSFILVSVSCSPWDSVCLIPKQLRRAVPTAVFIHAYLDRILVKSYQWNASLINVQTLSVRIS